MEPDSRINDFLELAELTPEDELVHYGLAQEYMKAGRFEEAAVSLERVIELKPDYAAAYREMGKALERAGNLEAAKDSFLTGRRLAEQHGDGQTVKEIDVYLKRIEKKNPVSSTRYDPRRT
jgi:tetratricopeptide (TPR) repeat protein